MGRVTETLLNLLRDQVRAKRVVVWFDPEQAYTDVADEIAKGLEGVHVERYDSRRGFLALRHDLEELWSAESDEPPQLLIYVPGLKEVETHHALVEFTVAGSVMAPGQQPPECDTALTTVARRALAVVYPPAVVEKFIAEIQQIQQSYMPLSVVEQLAEQGGEGHIGQLALIFETGNTEEIILHFLADATIDERLQQRGAVPALTELLAGALELSSVKTATLSEARAKITRLVLATEFLEALGEAAPSNLSNIARPTGKVARETAVRLARSWRQRRDLAESYIAIAEGVALDLRLANVSWTLETLRRAQTFLDSEWELQTLTEKALLSKPTEALIQLAHERQSGFWAIQKLNVKNRWKIVARAGEVILGATRLERELKADLSVTKLLTRYTSGDAPWCDLDTTFRQLDSERHTLVDPPASDSLVHLIDKAEQLYVRATTDLIGRFVRAYEAGKFETPDLTPQTHIFRDFVAPATENGVTAYILVDAFRFEMAREFLRHLPEDYTSTLKPALAVPPTITEVGMAALLPGAERSLALTLANDESLRVAVNGVTVKNSQDRLKLIPKFGNVSVETLPLHRVASLTDKKLRQKLSQARLIVVTASDEVDGLWESNPEIARRMPDFVFEQLRSALRVLFGLGVRCAIITADHGYLLGHQLQAGEGLEPPGGKTAVIKRRVWVGKGGLALPACLRQPVAAFGLSGDVELVTPYDFAYFSTAGQLEYFHGGLSPQEVVIPVLSITPGSTPALSAGTIFKLSATLSRSTITTRVFTATLSGEAGGLFGNPPSVQVHLRAGEQLVAMAAAATYGYQDETHDVALSLDDTHSGQVLPNTVILLLPDGLTVPAVNLIVLDSETGVILWQSANIPVEIAL